MIQRTNTRSFSLMALALLAACGPSDDVADRDPDELDGINGGFNDQEQLTAAFDLETSWTASTLKIEIFGGQGDTFFCGMAETGLDEDVGWYGESCLESQYCHSCGTLGVELRTGGDRDSLREGFETVFTGPSGVSFYVENINTEDCYVWGSNFGYYLNKFALDCQVWQGDDPE